MPLDTSAVMDGMMPAGLGGAAAAAAPEEDPLGSIDFDGPGTEMQLLPPISLIEQAPTSALLPTTGLATVPVSAPRAVARPGVHDNTARKAFDTLRELMKKRWKSEAHIMTFRDRDTTKEIDCLVKMYGDLVIARVSSISDMDAAYTYIKAVYELMYTFAKYESTTNNRWSMQYKDVEKILLQETNCTWLMQGSQVLSAEVDTVSGYLEHLTNKTRLMCMEATRRVTLLITSTGILSWAALRDILRENSGRRGMGPGGAYYTKECAIIPCWYMASFCFIRYVYSSDVRTVVGLVCIVDPKFTCSSAVSGLIGTSQFTASLSSAFLKSIGIDSQGVPWVKTVIDIRTTRSACSVTATADGKSCALFNIVPFGAHAVPIPATAVTDFGATFDATPVVTTWDVHLLSSMTWELMRLFGTGLGVTVSTASALAEQLCYKPDPNTTAIPRRGVTHLLTGYNVERKVAHEYNTAALATIDPALRSALLLTNPVFLPPSGELPPLTFLAPGTTHAELVETSIQQHIKDKGYTDFERLDVDDTRTDVLWRVLGATSSNDLRTLRLFMSKILNELPQSPDLFVTLMTIPTTTADHLYRDLPGVLRGLIQCARRGAETSATPPNIHQFMDWWYNQRAVQALITTHKARGSIQDVSMGSLVVKLWRIVVCQYPEFTVAWRCYPAMCDVLNGPLGLLSQHVKSRTLPNNIVHGAGCTKGFLTTAIQTCCGVDPESHDAVVPYSYDDLLDHWVACLLKAKAPREVEQLLDEDDPTGSATRSLLLRANQSLREELIRNRENHKLILAHQKELLANARSRAADDQAQQEAIATQQSLQDDLAAMEGKLSTMEEQLIAAEKSKQEAVEAAVAKARTEAENAMKAYKSQLEEARSKEEIRAAEEEKRKRLEDAKAELQAAKAAASSDAESELEQFMEAIAETTSTVAGSSIAASSANESASKVLLQVAQVLDAGYVAPPTAKLESTLLSLIMTIQSLFKSPVNPATMKRLREAHRDCTQMYERKKVSVPVTLLPDPEVLAAMKLDESLRYLDESDLTDCTHLDEYDATQTLTLSKEPLLCDDECHLCPFTRDLHAALFDEARTINTDDLSDMIQAMEVWVRSERAQLVAQERNAAALMQHMVNALTVLPGVVTNVGVNKDDMCATYMVLSTLRDLFTSSAGKGEASKYPRSRIQFRFYVGITHCMRQIVKAVIGGPGYDNCVVPLDLLSAKTRMRSGNGGSVDDSTSSMSGGRARVRAPSAGEAAEAAETDDEAADDAPAEARPRGARGAAVSRTAVASGDASAMSGGGSGDEHTDAPTQRDGKTPRKARRKRKPEVQPTSNTRPNKRGKTSHQRRKQPEGTPANAADAHGDGPPRKKVARARRGRSSGKEGVPATRLTRSGLHCRRV